MIQNPDKTLKRSYLKWSSMHRRKTDPTQTTHHYYKDTPICPSWDSYEKFESDMGEPPMGCILGRLDPNEGFHKWNCRWMPLKDVLKTRRKRKVNLNSVRNLAKVNGINASTLNYRLRHGYDMNRALSTPVRQYAPYGS